MPTKSTKKSILQYLGLGLFAISLLVFTAMLGLDGYKFSEEQIIASFAAGEDANYWQQDAADFRQVHLKIAGEETGLFSETFGSTFASESKLKEAYRLAQARVKEYYETEGLPQDLNGEGKPKTGAVSYTHLTLQTNYRGSLSAIAGSVIHKHTAVCS